jgi:phosphoglycerate dehydrogenase-like enzyme
MTGSSNHKAVHPSKGIRVAVIDDWQGIAGASIDWAPLRAKADVTFLRDPFLDEEHAAAELKDFDIVLSMRERTRFPASLINKLTFLKMLGITGPLGEFVDMDACTARSILICGTEYPATVSVAASELALGLMLAVARGIPAADANMRRGQFQQGLQVGIGLAGKTVGLLGLGRLGARMSQSCRALGMNVQAWSVNLTAEEADTQTVRYVSKDDLFSTSDVISIHLRLSNRTTGLVGSSDLSKMKKDAILINTSRGPIVDEGALIAALRSGRIRAGLDVFDVEPLPADHPLRNLPNVVLTPHLGYAISDTWAVFYGQSAENAIAFLDGKPIRALNSLLDPAIN